MEFARSKRGQAKIAYKGYLYRKDKGYATNIAWRCENSTCKARLSTAKEPQKGDDATERGTHSHPPDADKAKLALMKDEAIEQALGIQDTPRQILQNVALGASDCVAAALGAGTNLKQAINRARKAANDYPTRPRSAAELEIPIGLQTTYAGADFVLWDSGLGDVQRIIIFGTEESASWLQSSEHWLADGCFAVSPDVFLQLYSVHAIVEGCAIPCVYALMRSKDEASYIRLLG
eukprot:GEMP01051415.1.p1 GENE.GEMP01051415.1~~GEMP01051415.1.p1  ORF type:complete len:234 (+),score=37.45 GEMP01051415.1:41-742(+)